MNKRSTYSSLSQLSVNNTQESDSSISLSSDSSDEPELFNHENDSVGSPYVANKHSDEFHAGTCPICLDAWKNYGWHSLVALKCGHLFGFLCVKKWLKAQRARKRSCPTCYSRVNMKDLRFIYPPRLEAADPSQITYLQKQVETLQARVSKTDLELDKMKTAHRDCGLEFEVSQSTSMRSQVMKEQPVRKSWHFGLEKNLEICKYGSCRVMTYNCWTNELYVTQKNNNNMFLGNGIRKFSCVDYKLGQFLHLHNKPIKDITYSPTTDLLLSVGLDKTARIAEGDIPYVTVNTKTPLWSCSWDYFRRNKFYVGSSEGIILQYDVRNSSTYIRRLNAPGDMSPVVSLCSTEYGLLSCQLNSCYLWVANKGQWVARSLPVTGTNMSLCYDNESHRACIASHSPITSMGHSKLTLCRLKANFANDEEMFDIEESIPVSLKSNIISRPTWVRTPDATWVAVHSESTAMLELYGVDGSRSMSLSAFDPTFDVAAADLNGNTIMAALTASRIRLYKAVSIDY